jgi:hypothetical protein
MTTVLNFIITNFFNCAKNKMMRAEPARHGGKATMSSSRSEDDPSFDHRSTIKTLYFFSSLTI